MKHIFVINPAAGKGKGLELIPEIHKLFAVRLEEYIIEITEKPGHAEEISRRYAINGGCRIYSVGGDGTLNEVLNGVMGTEISLAVIPCGSGNDFIRSLAGEWDIENILERTVNGTERLIDVAKINERYFINIASMGFDAEVVFNSRTMKKIPGITGSVAYVAGILITVFKYSGCRLEVNIDGMKINKKILLVAIANGRYYGGGMIPTPEAKLDDGLIDICLIEAISKAKILAFFPKFIKGIHGKMKEVTFYKGRRVQIKTDRDISINIDGEVIRGREAVFEMLPSCINVVIPKE